MMLGGSPAAAALPTKVPSGPMQSPCWEEADAVGAFAAVAWLADGLGARLIGLGAGLLALGAGLLLLTDRAGA